VLLLIHTLCSSLQHVLILLSPLYTHQCPLFPCSNFYCLTTLWASTACYRNSFSAIANSHSLQFTAASTVSLLSPLCPHQCPLLPCSSSYCFTTLWASTACYRDSSSAIANSHSLQFTAARTESSQSTVSSPVSSASVLTFLLSHNSLPSSLSSRSSTELKTVDLPCQKYLGTDRKKITSANSFFYFIFVGCILLRYLRTLYKHII
jgi:hypothetical protein